MNKIAVIFKKIFIPYCIFAFCFILLYLSLFWLIFIKYELLNVNNSEFYRFWMSFLVTAIALYFFLNKRLALLNNLSMYYSRKLIYIAFITIFTTLLGFQTYLTEKNEKLTNFQFPLYFFIIGSIIIFLLLVLVNIDEIRIIKFIKSKFSKILK